MKNDESMNLLTFKELLLSVGISSYKLAKITRIPLQTIFDITQGKTEFKKTSLKNAIAISKALNIPLEDICIMLYGEF